MKQRLDAADALRRDQVNPYANDFRVSHQLWELPREVQNEEAQIADTDSRFAVAGRLVQVNEMGKARFMFLRGDRGEMIQLYVKADNAQAFAAAKTCDLG